METGNHWQQGKEIGWLCVLKALRKQYSRVNSRQREPQVSEKVQLVTSKIWHGIRKHCYSRHHVVNWSELALRYEVKNKNGEVARNGGQIVQGYLKSQGVDVTRFKKRGADGDG
jgi:hypothetical protein